jgi:hypothetical protein
MGQCCHQPAAAVQGWPGMCRQQQRRWAPAQDDHVCCGFCVAEPGASAECWPPSLRSRRLNHYCFGCFATPSPSLTMQYNHGSLSNGCLMRITPLIVWGHALPAAQLAAAACGDASLTHSNPTAQVWGRLAQWTGKGGVSPSLHTAVFVPLTAW